MNTQKSFFFILLLATLSSVSAKAGACQAEVKRNDDGAYSGCLVKMGDSENFISSERSSESGCHHVCEIMGEVNESKRHGNRAVGLQAMMGL